MSPDRPPSDIHLSRLALPGEVYALSYEENCGEGLEDRRNLHHVLIERRSGALHEVLREPLCGEVERGFALDLVALTSPGRPELVVRTWIVDPDGASEHTVRFFRPSAQGLALVGKADDAVDAAERFEAHYPRGRAGATLELRVRVSGADGGAAHLEVRRYRLESAGFVRMPGR